MADRNNLLIGYGERLSSDMAAPVAGAPKRHPYSFAEARRRLAPKIVETADELDELLRRGLPEGSGRRARHLAPYLSRKVLLPGGLAQDLWPGDDRQPRARSLPAEVDEEEAARVGGDVRVVRGGEPVAFPRSRRQCRSPDRSGIRRRRSHKDRGLPHATGRRKTQAATFAREGAAARSSAACTAGAGRRLHPGRL